MSRVLDAARSSLRSAAAMASASKQQSHPWSASQKGPPTLASVAEILSSDHPKAVKNVVLMVGSGVSVAAGLPDFRSPKTGLYANLQKYKLPYPEAIFDIDFFRDNPQPFFTFSKELFPGNFQPTLTHTFFTLLHEKGKLLRCFTQNIDTLERMANLPAEKLVEAHGSFATSQCINCHTPVTDDWMREKVMSGKVAYCEESRCRKRTGGKGALVKPDIVFFGEGLPSRFFECIPDLKKADLLIVLGTSLQVQPFASLIDRVPSTCPRVLINLERVGEIASYGNSSSGLDRIFGGMRGLMNESGFDFEGWTLKAGQGKEHIRDCFYEGRCDDGIKELARGIGWEKELIEMHEKLLKTMEKGGMNAKQEAKEHITDNKVDTAQNAEKKAEETAEKIAEVASDSKSVPSSSATTTTSSVSDKKADPADSVVDQLANLGIGDRQAGAMAEEDMSKKKSDNGSSL